MGHGKHSRDTACRVREQEQKQIYHIPYTLNLKPETLTPHNMTMGWNIFPMWTAIVVLFAATGSTIAVLRKGRNVWGMAMMLLAILGMAGFIGMLWATLERPPLRTMGETRLWYSVFLLMAGLFTYYRWQYRWIMLFSTVLASVFILINILKPEIHDQTLMPALQSVWFVPHVSVYMFS